MTPNKRNLKEVNNSNQWQVHIRKDSGNSAILYSTVIDLTANDNRKQPILKT